MKKLLSVFLIMFVFSYGIAYANNYGINSNENAIGISELQGHSYSVIILLPFMPMFGVFSFDESNNFTISISVFGQDFEGPSGYYTQTESTFTAHCEFLGMADIIHILDCEGTLILDMFIFGNLTIQPVIDDEPVVSSSGLFFGILSK